jgi:hypothetical protein
VEFSGEPLMSLPGGTKDEDADSPFEGGRGMSRRDDSETPPAAWRLLLPLKGGFSGEPVKPSDDTTDAEDSTDSPGGREVG